MNLNDLIEAYVFKRSPCDHWAYANLGSAGGPVMMMAGTCPIHGSDGCYPVPEWCRQKYDTDIRAAWLVWDWLCKQQPHAWALYSYGDVVVLEYYDRDSYQGLREAGSGEWQIEGPAPTAICRAALRYLHVLD